METIKEDYVSVEIAKLLKEKGFDWEVHRSYLVNDNCFAPADVNDLPYRKDAIRIPTLQMAMKWLRELHKIHITFYPYGEYFCDNYQFDVYKNNNLVVSKDDGYVTYEQACKSAIKYCLENLI